METIFAAGIRISEVQYITVEAARRGQAEISLKGKIRTILLSAGLCRRLLKYAKHKKSPPVKFFLPETGKGFPDARYGQK